MKLWMESPGCGSQSGLTMVIAHPQARQVLLAVLGLPAGPRSTDLGEAY